MHENAQIPAAANRGSSYRAIELPQRAGSVKWLCKLEIIRFCFIFGIDDGDV
jgi:hypothetical protein